MEDLGADSIDFVEVCMDLEEVFGITLDDEDAGELDAPAAAGIGIDKEMLKDLLIKNGYGAATREAAGHLRSPPRKKLVKRLKMRTSRAPLGVRRSPLALSCKSPAVTKRSILAPTMVRLS